MSAFDEFLAEQLSEIDRRNLRRRLREMGSAQGGEILLEGRELLHFSSNDYLGLAAHPALKEAAARAVEKFGVGSGASRLISGSQLPHHELEQSLAAFKGTEAALVFSTGYSAALGTITALVGREDYVVLDKLVHASIVDAARLSGATLRVFGHNDLADLESILQWCGKKRGATARVLIVTESLFSMDGDFAPLREMVALKERHGAWLMVDEAHATGLFGANRRGWAEAAGCSERIEIQMGTLGKALGASGGFICGRRNLIDLLINKARSFIFSTAPPAANSAAALAALKVVQSSEGAARLERLRRNVARFKNGGCSPIVPVPVGEESGAAALSKDLLERGVFVPAIRYPTVPRGKARLRISFSAAHREADVDLLASALEAAGGGSIPPEGDATPP